MPLSLCLLNLRDEDCVHVTMPDTEAGTIEQPPDAETTADQITLWTAVRESLRGGHHHDYTQGPIGRSIILLAIPMVLEMCMESVFAVVDTFWLARLGPGAIATVG